jgi:hypothetical protein
MKMTVPSGRAAKGEREDREGIERAGQLVDERKHQTRKYDHRRDRIDEEIEELGGAPDDDADGDLAGLGLPVSRLNRVAVSHCRGLCHRRRTVIRH